MPITSTGRRFQNRFRMNRHLRRRDELLRTTDGKQRIFGIRHGQTALDDLHRSDGWLDLPLNDEGRQSVVVTLSEFLKNVPVTKIYTPDLRRTAETAHILKSGITSNPKVVLDDGLKTWNLGSLAGDPKKSNKPFVRDLIDHPTKKAPDGESYAEFTRRFDECLSRLKQSAASSGPYLLVLSGSCCRHVGEELLNDRNALDMDESGLFVMYPEGGDWTAVPIYGHRDAEEVEKNPEVS